MNTIRNILITLSIIAVISSCTKEADEIPLADPGVSGSDFDKGYVGIRLKGSNSMLDSIVYTNTTKGFSFNIQPEAIIFIQGDTTGLLSKPLWNGNTGDDISCCAYVNTPTMIGISFAGSIPLDSVPTGKFCFVGKY